MELVSHRQLLASKVGEEEDDGCVFPTIEADEKLLIPGLWVNYFPSKRIPLINETALFTCSSSLLETKVW